MGGNNCEVVGSFNYNDITYLTFVVNPNGAFSVKRLQFEMRWWYDVFAQSVRFTYSKLGDDFKQVIEKLGLEIEQSI